MGEEPIDRKLTKPEEDVLVKRLSFATTATETAISITKVTQPEAEQIRMWVSGAFSSAKYLFPKSGCDGQQPGSGTHLSNHALPA